MCLEDFYHLRGRMLLKTHIVNSSEKGVPEKSYKNKNKFNMKILKNSNQHSKKILEVEKRFTIF